MAQASLSDRKQSLKPVINCDAALQEKVNEALVVDVTPAESRRVIWKLDLILMPLLGFCYMLQFLDKSSLNYSTLLGILKDNDLHGSEYSWSAGIFYFGYLFWSFPTSYLVVRFPIGKYLSLSVLVWGVVLMCHSACHSFASLSTARFFLGVTEAAVAPGFSLITGMFYQRKEQPFCHGLWFCGNSIASIIGGVLAYAIGTTNVTLAPWRLLFLVFGGITVLWAAIMFILLPDSPENARWLTAKQKTITIYRVLDNKTGIRSSTFKVNQVLEAGKDPKTWLLVGYIFCVNLPNGGLTAFGSLVLAGFGYKGLAALLLRMPAGAAQLGFVLTGTLLCSKLRSSRLITMFILTLISAAGMAMMYALPPGPSSRHARLAGDCLSMAFAANMPLGLSLISSNVAGFTKKSTVDAMVFVAYCVGNIVGPQFYLLKEAPRYGTGIKASLSGFCTGAFFLLCLRAYLMRENNRRDKVYGPAVVNDASMNGETVAMESTGDLMGWEIESFRYPLWLLCSFGSVMPIK